MVTVGAIFVDRTVCQFCVAIWCEVCVAVEILDRAAIWCGVAVVLQILDYGYLRIFHSYISCFHLLNKYGISLVYLNFSLFSLFI